MCISYKLCEQTTAFRNVYDEHGRRRRQYLIKLADPIRSDQVPSEWKDAKIVHACPVMNEFPTYLLNVFSSKIGISPQGWMRRCEQGIIKPKLWNPQIMADVMILSSEDVVDEPERYTNLAKILAITRGKDGVDVYLPDKHHVLAFEISTKDPTGAGDAFAAAFLIRCFESKDPIDAARFAACVASFVVEAKGTFGIPTKRDVLLELSEKYKSNDEIV